MRARLVTAVALVCALSACTGSDDSERADAGPAPQAVASAVDAWTEADTGRFRFFMGEENDYLLASEGVYRLADGLTEVGIVLRNGEQTVTAETIRDPGTSWTRTATGETTPDGCWLRMTGAQAASESGLAGGEKAAGAGIPALSVLEQAEGVEWVEEGTVVKATTDLYSLVTSLGQTWKQLDLDPKAGDRAEITVLLDKGEVVAWRTDLGSVLETVRESGVELTPQMGQMVAADVEIPVTASFSDLGDEVEITPPARRQSFDWSKDPAKAEQARASCEARGA